MSRMSGIVRRVRVILGEPSKFVELMSRSTQEVPNYDLYETGGLNSLLELKSDKD